MEGVPTVLPTFRLSSMSVLRRAARPCCLALVTAVIGSMILCGCAGVPEFRAPIVEVQGTALKNGVSPSLFRLIGFDVSGTEAGCVSGWGISTAPISASEAHAIASWHVNAVRVPLNEDCWLGINGLGAKYAGAPYRNAIHRWVKLLGTVGICVILDLHWSAPGRLKAIGQWPMPDSSHANRFWSEVAKSFRTDPSVIFDLFDEPALGGSHPLRADWSCLLRGCVSAHKLGCGSASVACPVVTYAVAGTQSLVDAIRSTGARQPIMVAGLAWASDPCGLYDTGGNSGQCMWVEYEPVDPLHQIIASYHAYSRSICKVTSCWDKSVSPVLKVAPVVTGEFGETDGCKSRFVRSYMTWADRSGISYLAWNWGVPTLRDVQCRSANLQLIRNWSGKVNLHSPAAVEIQAHFAYIWRK